MYGLMDPGGEASGSLGADRSSAALEQRSLDGLADLDESDTIIVVHRRCRHPPPLLFYSCTVFRSKQRLGADEWSTRGLLLL